MPGSRVSRAAHALLALLGAMALACGGDPVTPDAGSPPDGYVPGRDPRVELGTGGASFVSIPASGGTLELVFGPQGGWHLDASVRLYDLTIDALLLRYEIERGGSVIGMAEYSLELFRVVPEGDHYLRAGDRVIFALADGNEVVGETLDVIATADPADGDPVTDRRTIVVVDEQP